MADESEHTESDIWASPDANAVPRPKAPRTPKTPKTPSEGQHHERDEPEDHEEALRRELEGVRAINEGLEGVLATLERSGGNMQASVLTLSPISQG